MKLNKGIFKICHGFPYDDDASLEVKTAVIEATLEQICNEGYDGVVTNAPHDGGYLKTEENLQLTEAILAACKRLSLRVWLYDEKAYPSGAAGVQTLSDDPSLEAKALAAVHKLLPPGESTCIPLPHGHLTPMGAVAYSLTENTLSDDGLRNAVMRPVYGKEGYRFDNATPHPLLCLAFFTKPAFEGTHCQHNAAFVRRYVDLAHPRSGAAFVENTYKPYFQRLAPYFADGTAESFFMDEPSYMGVYFNLKKTPCQVTHLPDPALPLYAMVTWSDGLEERFFEEYGYSLTERLAWLFMGGLPEARRLRRDYYRLLTALAQRHFFAPIAAFCQQAGVCSSGHILLEERITDHPRFQGSFFPLLSTMHVPGMDMLDSLPQRVWKKAFTPLLVSSISRLYREGDVMDEVSAHFQHKFSVPVSSRQLFASLAIQHFFGATLFTSYYADSDPLSEPTPAGQSTLAAFGSLLRSTGESLPPALYLHYPIEDVMANTVSPVDVATVYDSILNEYTLPYPLDRADLDRRLSLQPLVKDGCSARAKAVERTMEEAMFALMDRQIPFLFTDTASLERLSPSLLLIDGDTEEEALLALVPELLRRGWRIYAAKGSRPLPAGVLALSLSELSALVPTLTQGDTAGVAALHTAEALYLANSDDRPKTLSLRFAADTITLLYENAPLSYETASGKTRLTLPPYGVVRIEGKIHNKRKETKV